MGDAKSDMKSERWGCEVGGRGILILQKKN